jgi:tryptophan halogenase
METVAQRFNEAFTYRWERVIDFLKLHYVLSKRSDSAFWREHRDPATIPARLRELLALWRTRAPSQRDFYRIEEVFPSASYQYILYGMGFRTEAAGRASDLAQDAELHFRETQRLASRMGALLPANRELLAHLQDHDFPRR